VTAEQVAAANQPARRPPTLFGRGEVNPFAAVSAVQGAEQALGGLKPGLQVAPGEGMVFVMGPSTTPTSEIGQLDARMKGQVAEWEQQDRMQAAAVAAGATLATQQVELGLSLRKAQLRGRGFDRSDDIETARQVAAIREEALKWELALTGDIGKYRQESLQNELQMRMKIAEQENREAEDQERRIEALQHKAEGLLHTLFTKPGSFGTQLRGTVRDGLLKPIEKGVGDMVATTIAPVIYGSEGQGGNAGLFRGALGADQHNPAKVSTDLNTAVTAQNSAALAALTAVLARSMGISAPAIAVPSIPSIGSMNIPGIGTAVPGGAPVDWLRGLPRFAEGGVTSGPSIAGEAGPELIRCAPGALGIAGCPRASETNRGSVETLERTWRGHRSGADRSGPKLTEQCIAARDCGCFVKTRWNRDHRTHTGPGLASLFMTASFGDRGHGKKAPKKRSDI
jgi:hypothetical protein